VSNRRVVLPGVILGIVVLALAAVFAIVLPKVHSEGGELSLPDKLPGGYAATDLSATWKNAPEATDDKIETAAAGERSSRSYGDKAFDQAGIDAVTRSYVDAKFEQPVVVQAFRAAGGAFAPFQFTDPKTAQPGQQVQRLVRKGDALCIEVGSADGTGGSQPAYVECQRSEGELTVQVTSPLELAKAVDLVDAVFAELS
jgi:hypothetical protein